MTRRTAGAVAIVMALLGAPVLAAGQCAAYPLTTVPQTINIRTGSILEALVQFGQSNSVCFGIEVMDDRLAATGADWHQAAPLRDLLQSALSNVEGYRVRARGPVVSISPARSGAPTWLDAKIPAFSATRRADVQSVNNLLFMDLILVENPRHGALAVFIQESLPTNLGRMRGALREIQAAFGSP